MTEFEWIAATVQRIVLWLEPSGGQTVARRNAWASLVADSRRKAQRLEADRAIAATLVGRREHAEAV